MTSEKAELAPLFPVTRKKRLSASTARAMDKKPSWKNIVKLTKAEEKFGGTSLKKVFGEYKLMDQSGWNLFLEKSQLLGDSIQPEDAEAIFHRANSCDISDEDVNVMTYVEWTRALCWVAAAAYPGDP